jgi:uncharacterized glyoxalase superfamily protein PhnB
MPRGGGGPWRIAPVLISKDLAGALPYWCDRLGFSIIDILGDAADPKMAFVERGGVQFMLQDGKHYRTPGSNRDYKPGTWDAHVWCDDADALHADMAARGAAILSPPCDTFYGNREFEVADPDGHVIAFGSELKG